MSKRSKLKLGQLVSCLEEAKVWEIVVVGKQQQHAIYINREERGRKEIREKKREDGEGKRSGGGGGSPSIQLALKPFLSKTRDSIDKSDPARDPDDVPDPALPNSADDA
ncbi:Outer envelope membrane protein 7, partial [Mucuna pruriens]